MKISYMLKREDFYSINKNTLDSYFTANGKRTRLYIYPNLNAIITACPSKEVCKYLLSEYSLRAKRIKRIFVKNYVRLCLASRGLLSSKHVDVNGNVGNGILIYPCNKKYRIFDFPNGVVDVIIKNGFSTRTIQHELLFRSQYCVPDFVPTLILTNKNCYREKIIDGRPLPRISFGFEAYRDAAYKLLSEFQNKQIRKVSGRDYSKQLKIRIEELATKVTADKRKIIRIVQILSKKVAMIETIIVCLSHGDFQPGNIWVENGTEKIFIIDWESWGERSIWYDKAAVFYGLRRIDSYLQSDVPLQEKATVLLEDLIYQIDDLNDLPLQYGETQFFDYLVKVEKWCITSTNIDTTF